MKWVSCWSSSIGSFVAIPGAVDADLAAVGVDLDVDVLFVGDAPVGGGDRLLDGADELLARDLLLGVELKEGADEIPTHVVRPPLRFHRVVPFRRKKYVGVTHVRGGRFCSPEYTRERRIAPTRRPTQAEVATAPAP